MTVVVDTSAIVYMLLGEPEASQVGQVLAADDEPLMSAATFVETMIVAEGRKGPAGALKAEQIVRESGITVVPHDADVAVASVDGWRRFGKGRHPAALNLGDCYAYGLARVRNLPVLCVGGDLARTDVATLP